ncbi:hypothetical protein ACOTET_22890 [Achromobacter xylosoxidans]
MEDKKEEFTPNPQALALATHTLFLSVVQAIFLTHPKPQAFAEALHQSAQEFRDHLLSMPAPEVTFEIFDELLLRMTPEPLRPNQGGA